MTSLGVQLELLLPAVPDLRKQIREAVLSLRSKPVQPSARELLAAIERQVDVKARWEAKEVIRALTQERSFSQSVRAYLHSMLESGDLEAALRGEGVPDKAFASSIDSLLREVPMSRATCRAAMSPKGVPMDLTSKFVGRIEQMATGRRPRRARRDSGRRTA